MSLLNEPTVQNLMDVGKTAYGSKSQLFFQVCTCSDFSSALRSHKNWSCNLLLSFACLMLLAQCTVLQWNLTLLIKPVNLVVGGGPLCSNPVPWYRYYKRKMK